MIQHPVSFYRTLQQRWLNREKRAIQTDDITLSYADLDNRVGRAMGWLDAQGLVRGDVLAVQIPRALCFLELHLAALARGITTLAINPRYTPAELAFYLSDSGAKLAILIEETTDTNATVHLAHTIPQQLAESPIGAEPQELPDDTTAMLMYTSGTTGRPKGAVISHANLAGTVRALHEAWQWQPQDVLLHALPLFHIHGLFVAQHGALYANATTIWMAHFGAKQALETIESQRCSVLMGVPTFYNRFLALPATVSADLSSMRLFTSGSAPLPARVHEGFYSRFGHQILERYGMTEVGIVLSNPYGALRKPGTVGFPLPGVKIRIVDEQGQDQPAGQPGELWIQGPSVISGYRNLPEQTAETITDGWLHSGDIAREDPDGYIQIVGRAKDMIITGGLNVYPVEIESALLKHPDVAEVAVVGVADDDWGEVVVAMVVPAPGAKPSPDMLRSFVRETLSHYKCPKSIRLADQLPRNAMGKVQKSVIRTDW